MAAHMRRVCIVTGVSSFKGNCVGDFHCRCRFFLLFFLLTEIVSDAGKTRGEVMFPHRSQKTATTTGKNYHPTFLKLFKKLNSLQRYDITQNYIILQRVVQCVST
jgi:hypothetical protein